MGWLYQDDPVADPVAELTAHFTCDGHTRTWLVLAAARVANTVYMAVKSTDKATGESYVFAAVILISNTKKHGFGYKDMDESVGPCQCDCPDRIMRLLTPIDDLPNPGYAADWRARVEARKNAKRHQTQRRQSLRVGSIVTLPTAASFRGGITASRFRVAHFRRRTPIFEALDPPGFLCRLTAAALSTATIDVPPTDNGQPGWIRILVTGVPATIDEPSTADGQGGL
ncbi:MAG: hypothetical protein WB611_06685 [Stellaceae bacterium]